MNKCFFAALVALLVLPTAFGEAVYERSFGEMGYEDFLVDGPAGHTGCFEAEFIYPADIAIENREIYPIASIGLEFGPVQEGKIDVNAFLNGKVIAENYASAGDFKCKEGVCWERLFLPKNALREEENRIKVCLGTGNTITSIKLKSGSGVGLYKTADFSGENAFRMDAEKTGLVIGEKTTITILLHNEGSAVTNARVEFARPLAEDKNAFSVVEGDTYFTGLVKPGETVEISYVVKPRVPVHMTLPPAIVYYENEFEEQEAKFSNLVSLDVRQPERKIEAFIVKKEENAFVGQPIELTLAVKNIGLDPLYDLGIRINSATETTGGEAGIGSIQPKETKYVNFSVNSGEAGKFPISCTITYTDVNISESQCQDSFVEFSQPEINPLIYVGIALVLVAIAVYVYIMKTG
ncbi:MAG: hypothetical protein WC634_00745 [archaeon]